MKALTQGIHAIAVVLLVSGLALAQTRAAAPSPADKSQGGKPDLSGIWLVRHFKQRIATYNPEFEKKDPPMLPAADKQYKEIDISTSPTAHCLPPGAMGFMNIPSPLEIIQQPNRVLLISEFDHLVRRIYTDGRKHPDDLDPTWLGHSIGRWEGDTLLVDTIGFNDRAWLDFTGLRQTPSTHMTEKIRRKGSVMEDEITIEDPATFSRPWSVTVTWDNKPDWEIMEYICAENNKSEESGDTSKAQNKP